MAHEFVESTSEVRYPWQFSWSAWKRIFSRIYQNTEEQRIGLIAAGIAFFLLLSIFPLLIALISVFGLLANPQFISDQLGGLLMAIPAQGRVIVQDQLNELVTGSTKKLSIGLIVSILGAFWSSSKGARALISGMNVVYKEKEKRGIIKLYSVSLVFTLGILVLGILAPFILSILPTVVKYVFPTLFRETALELFRWIASFFMAMMSLAFLQRYAPSRKDPKWRWVTVGSLATTTVWLLGSLLLGLYFELTSSLEAYGSLAGVIALMLWVYVASYITLLGALLDAEMEHETKADSTIGSEKPMGKRGAVVADTLP